MSTTETKPSIGCLKVSSKSSPASVAGAIAGMIKDGASVEIQAVGAGAVNQAVKAVAISRGFLSPVGIEICCIPSFADIVIDGEYRTAIRFAVEPRGAAAIAPIVDAAAFIRGFAMSNAPRELRFCIHTFGCQDEQARFERPPACWRAWARCPSKPSRRRTSSFMTCCVREAADTRLYGQVASMKNIPLRDGTPLTAPHRRRRLHRPARDGDKLLAALPPSRCGFRHSQSGLFAGARRAIEHGRAAEVIEGERSSPPRPRCASTTGRRGCPSPWDATTFTLPHRAHVRGREKSRPLDDIAEARSHAEWASWRSRAGAERELLRARPYGEPRFADVLRAVDARASSGCFATSHLKDLNARRGHRLFATLPAHAGAAPSRSRARTASSSAMNRRC